MQDSKSGKTPKNEELEDTDNLPIDLHILNSILAFDLHSKEEKLKLLECTINRILETIDKYYDKQGAFSADRNDKKREIFAMLSGHNLLYEKDSVFYSAFLHELARNYFRCIHGNKVTIDGLIEFSAVVQVDDCIERIGEFCNLDDCKNGTLESEFYRRLVSTLENEIQNSTIKPNQVNWYLKLLKGCKGSDEFFMHNKKELLKVSDDILTSLEIMGDEYREDKEVIEIVENRMGELAEQLIMKCGIPFANDNVKEWVEILLREVAKNEKTSVSKLKWRGGGNYSNVFLLGEKVIKIGKENAQFSIPRNMRRFIQPVVRMEIDDLHFEVTQKVLPVKEEEVTEEERYSIYKELRDAGLCWIDSGVKNLGRLLKPNEIYVDSIKETGGKPKRSFGPNVGISKDEDVEVLGAGELVIIDLDYIYPYSYLEKKNMLNGGILKKFSDRYEEEKKKEEKNEIEENRE